MCELLARLGVTILKLLPSTRQADRQLYNNAVYYQIKCEEIIIRKKKCTVVILNVSQKQLKSDGGPAVKNTCMCMCVWAHIFVHSVAYACWIVSVQTPAAL